MREEPCIDLSELPKDDGNPHRWRPYQQPLLPDYNPDDYDNSSG